MIRSMKSPAIFLFIHVLSIEVQGTGIELHTYRFLNHNSTMFVMKKSLIKFQHNVNRSK